MIPFTSIIVFILGATFGSFLSVVIHRLNAKQKGIIVGHSICPHCKQKLKWQHLVPIISWLVLRGKCAYCKKSISSHYIVLELIMGLLFLGTFFHLNFIEAIPSSVDPNIFNYSIDWKIFEIFIFYLVEITFLMAIFFYDLMHKEIPDRFSLPAIAIAILGGFIFGFPTPLGMLIGGAGIFTFFLLQFVLSRGTWIGGGDLRLGALMGVLLGWEYGLLALVIAYLIGGVFSIFLLATKKVTKKTAIPFGPFMVTGTLMSLFFGSEILDWYFNGLMF